MWKEYVVWDESNSVYVLGVECVFKDRASNHFNGP